MDIRSANRDYEHWLAAELHGAIVADDLKTKHKKMCESPFAFLGATYWRRAETILDVCPDLANAPAVPAVGDTHLENFGTWRDEDGRLVWGINDFDEAAAMPYPFDLVRLGASAVLATPGEMSLKSVCGNLLKGYEHGLEAPQAFVLDRDHLWLRNRFVVDEAARGKFWQKIDDQYSAALKHPEQPPADWRKLLTAALPQGASAPTFWRHTAGTGSLGRPRWLCFATWRSAPLLREGKQLVPSGWNRAHGGRRLGLNDVARGRFRAPDPWYTASGHLLVRRLSANSRKLDTADRRDRARLLHPDLLWDMGRDLAAVHLGIGNRRDALRADLAKRKRRWFRASVEAAADFIAREFAEWKKSAK